MVTSRCAPSRALYDDLCSCGVSGCWRAFTADRIREAKLGAGLIHLPSGYTETNTVWMWAALLAGNLSTLPASTHRHRHRSAEQETRHPGLATLQLTVEAEDA